MSKPIKFVEKPLVQEEISDEAVESFLMVEEPPESGSGYAEDSMSMPECMRAIYQLTAIGEQQQAELLKTKAAIVRLRRRFERLSNTFLVEMGAGDDKRTVFNPEKNLKISVKKAYHLAKDMTPPLSADDARKKAFNDAMKSARQKYYGDPGVKPFLKRRLLPLSVMEYIEYWYRHYDEITATDDVEDVDETVQVSNFAHTPQDESIPPEISAGAIE